MFSSSSDTQNIIHVWFVSFDKVARFNTKTNKRYFNVLTTSITLLALREQTYFHLLPLLQQWML